MAAGKGIQARRGRRKIKKAFELQLTSMMDVMVIIVVFLLKSYNVSTNNFSVAAGMQLPFSSSKQSPNDSIGVQVTPEAITVENERILDFIVSQGNETEYKFKPTDLDEGEKRIIPLYDALMKAREKTELLLAKSSTRLNGAPIPFEGILAIQADKRIQYETLRKIMYTAAAAGYKTFRFLALKRET